MIAEIDEDHDGQVSYREFLLIFRKVLPLPPSSTAPITRDTGGARRAAGGGADVAGIAHQRGRGGCWRRKEFLRGQGS